MLLSSPAPADTSSVAFPVPSDMVLHLVAKHFKLLSDEFRLKLLLVIGLEELSVNQIMVLVDAKQTTVSKHLQMLLDGNFIRCRKQGRSRMYTVAEPAIFELYYVVRDALATRLAENIAAVSPPN